MRISDEMGMMNDIPQHFKTDAPTQILDLTALNCSSHVRLSSMTTPRDFDIGTRFISVPFNKEILLGTEYNALLMKHHTLSLARNLDVDGRNIKGTYRTDGETTKELFNLKCVITANKQELGVPFTFSKNSYRFIYKTSFLL